MKDFIRSLHIKWLGMKARRAPELELPTEGSVLIVAPHPDDEVIGCGGLIARLVSEGRAPHIAVLTGGEGSHRGCGCGLSAQQIVSSRRQLTRDALKILGVPIDNLHEFNFKDGEIPSISNEKLENEESEIEIDRLRELITELRPSAIFVPHWGEGWPDHVNTRNIILNSQFSILNSPKVYEYCVWMWYYNVWRGLDWKQAYSLKMTPHEHQLKQEAIAAYTLPTAPCGRPWSGNLPPLFLRAHTLPTELYFKSEERNE